MTGAESSRTHPSRKWMFCGRRPNARNENLLTAENRQQAHTTSANGIVLKMLLFSVPHPFFHTNCGIPVQNTVEK